MDRLDIGQLAYIVPKELSKQLHRNFLIYSRDVIEKHESSYLSKNWLKVSSWGDKKFEWDFKEKRWESSEDILFTSKSKANAYVKREWKSLKKKTEELIKELNK